VDIPEHIRSEKRQFVERNGGTRMDDVEFTFVKGRFRNHGEATFWNRCKSHEDVAERWYPEVWRKIQEDKQKTLVDNGPQSQNNHDLETLKGSSAIEAH
jgi:hypothetical protein